MTYPIVLLLLFGALFVLYVLFLAWRHMRTRRLRRLLETMPFPETYRTHLRRIAHYNALSSEERAKVERAVLRFIRTKEFAGIRLQIDEEMKVVVAFYASLMVLHKARECYGGLKSILLYSGAFLVEEAYEEGGIVTRGEFELDGQSSGDTVVLSWEDARAEAYDLQPYNVIIHEFAHILDFEEGMAADTPPTEKVLQREYDTLFDAMQSGDFPEGHLLGVYALHNKAEFFAVSSERFFQCPARLADDLPELFDALRRFYGCDPRRWGVEAPFP